MERLNFAYVGTVDDVRREMDAMVENINPEWFVWHGYRGIPAQGRGQEQIETFGRKVLPRYK